MKEQFSISSQNFDHFLEIIIRRKYIFTFKRLLLTLIIGGFGFAFTTPSAEFFEAFVLTVQWIIVFTVVYWMLFLWPTAIKIRILLIKKFKRNFIGIYFIEISERQIKVWTEDICIVSNLNSIFHLNEYSDFYHVALLKVPFLLIPKKDMFTEDEEELRKKNLLEILYPAVIKKEKFIAMIMKFFYLSIFFFSCWLMISPRSWEKLIWSIVIGSFFSGSLSKDFLRTSDFIDKNWMLLGIVAFSGIWIYSTLAFLSALYYFFLIRDFLS